MPSKIKVRVEDEKFLQQDTRKNQQLKPGEKIKDLHIMVKKSKQTAHEEDYVADRVEEIRVMKDQRDKPSELLGQGENQTQLKPEQYWRESHKRVNSISEKPDYKDDWQADVFDPVTRNKMLAVLARLAAQRIMVRFRDAEGFDSKTPKVITNLYENSARGKYGVGSEEILLFYTMFEAAIKGAALREEGYYEGRRRVKTSRSRRGNWKYKSIYDYEDVMSWLIPIESFVPGDITKLSVQEMGRAAIELLPDFDTFKKEYADYSNIHKVQPLSAYQQSEVKTFGLPHGAEAGDKVIVRKYWNSLTDTFDVMANNILLTEPENPLSKTYVHGQIPLHLTRFEPLSVNYYLGMSLPFKLASFQDMTNAIWNMSLDQMFIALKSPIFNASGSDIDLDWLYPANVIDLDQGTDLNSIREFKISPQTNFSTGLLNVMQQRMNESTSTGHEQSGIAGAGRVRTAEEVATARQASLEIMGLFLKQMEWAEEARLEQRAKNLLYYYSKRLKSTGKHRKVVVENVRLLNDALGKMEINIRPNPRSQEQLNVLNERTEENSQVVDIKPSAIRNAKIVAELVPNSSLKETEREKKENEIAWRKLTGEDPMVNQEESLKALAEVYGKDPSKVIKSQPALSALDQIPGQQGQGGQKLDPNNLKRAINQSEKVIPNEGI